MSLLLIYSPLVIPLYGIGGVVNHEPHGRVGMRLMDEMWKLVKGQELKNKGLNHWVYEDPSHMFAGVELESPPVKPGLTFKEIGLNAYARWKHIGPYAQLPSANLAFKQELKNRSIPWHYPQLEIYGHWSADETKAETDILFAID